MMSIMIQQVLKNRSGNLNRNGFHIRYSIEGSGQVVVVIGSVLYYHRLFSLNLRNHFQLVFLDHKGFTPGPKVDASAITMNELVEDIEFMRQSLGLEKFVIVGHSGHGYMALEYAKKHFNIVTKVVLIGMGPDQSQESRVASEQYLQDSACPDRKVVLEKNLACLSHELQASPDKRFITFCLRLGAKSWYNFNFDASFLWDGVYVNMPIIDRLWGQIFADVNITQGLDQLNIPIFLALGKFDYLVAPFYTWYSIRSKFKNLTISLFELSSHAPQFEEADLFDKNLIEWLKHK